MVRFLRRWWPSIAGVAVLAAMVAVGWFTERERPPSPLQACEAAGYPTTFDRDIQRAVVKHWPIEWADAGCEWRAQLAAESSLDAATCDRANSAGAKCLAQILPGTAADIEAATGLRQTRSDAAAAIYGGAWYMAQLGEFWAEPRSDLCRRRLARASYISGVGNIRNAQLAARALGELAVCMDGVQPHLITVISAANAANVEAYIAKIDRLAARMAPR